MISCGRAVPSTPIELVSRLTEQLVTPATCDTAFSTRALQAAQLIPVTVYCSIWNPTPLSHPFLQQKIQHIHNTLSSSIARSPNRCFSLLSFESLWLSRKYSLEVCNYHILLRGYLSIPFAGDSTWEKL
jgi:hypothetical protein